MGINSLIIIISKGFRKVNIIKKNYQCGLACNPNIADSVNTPWYENAFQILSAHSFCAA